MTENNGASVKTENTNKSGLIVLRYGEIGLKGLNRRFFENALVRNIRASVDGYNCRVDNIRGRLTVEGYRAEDAAEITTRLRKVFGLYSLSEAVRVRAEYNEMRDAAVNAAAGSGSFKVIVNRGDKTFPKTSTELCREFGAAVLERYPDMTVDVHNPAQEICLDIRENGYAFLFGSKQLCVGGMPVGSSGTALALLSGGIDSPVAAYCMAKRGLKLAAIHFFSYPYTSEAAREKVIGLWKDLRPYTLSEKLYMVPFTEIQESIRKYSSAEYTVILMRRFMMRIAARVANKARAGAIVTGESLAQVASQTLQGITVTNAVSTLPVFRPLIGMDKSEIIARAKEIGTFERSILPYEDCCTVFVPDHPVTKPEIGRVEYEESKIEGYEELIERALAAVEIV